MFPCVEVFLAAAPVTVEIDWLEQLSKGGWVVWVQALLVVAMVAIVIERTLALRLSRFVPNGFIKKVLEATRRGDGGTIMQLCRRTPSVVGSAVLFGVEHSESDPGAIGEGMRDIVQQRVDLEYEKLASLSLIAATAPLLGLLGTMIGMIESFQLVALFGDEGGASLLADSIAKALITTAVGLVIALPALFFHHVFKRKVQEIARKLEWALGEIHREWFLRRGGSVDPVAAPAVATPTPLAVSEPVSG